MPKKSSSASVNCSLVDFETSKRGSAAAAFRRHAAFGDLAERLDVLADLRNDEILGDDLPGLDHRGEAFLQPVLDRLRQRALAHVGIDQEQRGALPALARERPQLVGFLHRQRLRRVRIHGGGGRLGGFLHRDRCGRPELRVQLQHDVFGRVLAERLRAPRSGRPACRSP
jgi:hypothetical protein